MPHDVFISYAHQDQKTALAICAGLEAQGIPCWIAARDIGPGNEWAESIAGAVKSSKAMVVVMTTSAVRVSIRIDQSCDVKWLPLSPICCGIRSD